MARKFITLQAHMGEDHLNPEWCWEKVLKYMIQIQLKIGLPVISLSIGSAQAPTWAYGNGKWLGEFPGLKREEIALFKEYLRLGGGLMYYEAPWNARNPWYPGLPDGGRSFEDYINAACRRLTNPFNPFTGKYDLDNDNRPFGIDAVHQIFGDLGDYSKIKAVIGQHTADTCWASYLCGVERCEAAGSGYLGPVQLGEDWLYIYQTLLEETPFYWATGMQSQFNYDIHFNINIRQTHLFKADQKSREVLKARNWCTKTPRENATFNVEWLLQSEELEDVRILSFISIKDRFLKNFPMQLAPIFPGKDTDWRRYRIPGQITPRIPVNLPEAHTIDALKGTDSQLYGLWKDYYLDMFLYLDFIQQNNENLIICSDAKTKDMVKQQYHESGVVLTHQKILDIAAYLVNTTNWQVAQNEQYGPSETFQVTRPPDWVKILVDSENEFYTLAEAWWIMLYAMFMIASNDGLTTIPNRILRPVIGPCEPSVCPQISGSGVNMPTEDTGFSINVWWQHDEYEDAAITFAELKNLALGLFPNAKTNQPVGPEHFSDRRVFLPKVLWCCHLNDDNGDPILANAAELLYILAKMLVNWSLSPTSPADVQFMPSHVLPKLYPLVCQNSNVPNPFLSTEAGQPCWFFIGQCWTVKLAVLKPEYR